MDIQDERNTRLMAVLLQQIRLKNLTFICLFAKAADDAIEVYFDGEPSVEDIQKIVSYLSAFVQEQNN